MTSVVQVVLIVLIAACGAGCRNAAAGSAVPPGSATVVRVVDGDTLVADIGGREEHVRLIGIDTPETHKPDAPVECFGAEATHELEELLPADTTITLVRDVEARDVYDRLLAYVYRKRDELFVNLEMANEGFAAALTIPPNVAHTDEFTIAAGAARDAGLGLWGACGGPDTPVQG